MNEASALRSKGISALLSGSLAEAHAALARAVELAPFDAIARHNLALVARLRGAPNRARDEAASAAAIGHARPDVLAAICAQLALHARLVGRDNEARSALDRALDANPRHAVSWYYRGLFARLDGEIDASIAHLRRAIAADTTELPRLVRSRIEGMLADAIALGVDRAEPIRAASMIAAISEPILSDQAPAVLDMDVASDAATRDARSAPAREITAQAAARALHEARSITVLTGAGCSAASGLSTRKELWKRFDKDSVVTTTHNDLRSLWLVVLDFIGGRRPLPNPAHDVIAALPRVRAIITQNVDELHQRARRDESSPPVLELHGTLDRLRCARCSALDPRTARDVTESEEHGLPPLCAQCKARAVRPDVVLFGEWVDSELLARAVDHVRESDVLLVVGCAMDVAPASELPRIASESGATVIEVKRGPSRLSRSLATWLVRGPCEEILPAMYEELSTLESLPSLREERSLVKREAVRWSARSVAVGSNGAELYVGAALVGEGASVQAGQPVVLLECDKATIDVDAPIDGTIVRIERAPSTLVLPGAAVATIEPTPETEVARRVRETKSRSMLDDGGRGIAPIVLSFGAHTEALRALFELVANARWLQPDAALAAMRDEATSWINDRADELRAALGADESELRLALFRDGFEAFSASRDAWTAPLRSALSARDGSVPRWLNALDTAGAQLAATAPSERQLSSASSSAVVAACHTARQWAGSAIDPAPSSLLAVADLSAQHIARHGAGSPTPSAFRPLLALWLRGAWPFALPDGLGVWVPLYEDGAIIPNPTATEREARARWPEDPRGSPECPRPTGHGLSALWPAPRAR